MQSGGSTDLWAAKYSRLGFAHAKLLAVIKRETEGVTKGGERPLRGIGLGTFERKLVSLPRGKGLAFPSP